MKSEDFTLDKDFYEKLMARMFVKRAAANCWASRFDDSVRDFDTVINSEIYCHILGQREIAYLKSDRARVLKRHSSQEIKKEGDILFY
jgi:uncharacterized protein (UPF0264 family)